MRIWSRWRSDGVAYMRDCVNKEAEAQRKARQTTSSGEIEALDMQKRGIPASGRTLVGGRLYA